jgi:transposase
LSTKIYAVVDALENPLSFHLTGGQASDLEGADELLPNLEADTIIAEKGYDTDERVRQVLDNPGKTPVIPFKKNRKQPQEYDRYLCKARHLVENFFAKLKPYRAIATRYDKRATSFLGAILFSCYCRLA